MDALDGKLTDGEPHFVKLLIPHKNIELQTAEISHITRKGHSNTLKFLENLRAKGVIKDIDVGENKFDKHAYEEFLQLETVAYWRSQLKKIGALYYRPKAYTQTDYSRSINS